MDSALNKAFNGLAEAGIPYVVLRGYWPITALTASADIDLFIAADSFAKAKIVLTNAGWCYRRFQVGKYPHHFFDRWDGDAGFVRSLDVVTDLYFGVADYKLSNANRVLESAVSLDNVRVPAAWHAAFCFSLHVLLDKKAISEANSARAKEFLSLCDESPSGALQLEHNFGHAASLLVREALPFFANNANQDITHLLPLLSKIDALAPASKLRAVLHKVSVRWRQLIRPVTRVAIIGIDGSGKSTLLHTVTSNSGTVRIHGAYLGNNSFRTPPARYFQAKLEALRASDNPNKLLYRVIANLDALWRPLELAARMMIAEHRAEVVLYDRFPLGQDDGNPTTAWGRAIRAYTLFFRKLLPGPDLVVLLDGDDHTIWSRKREMPFELHQETQNRYRRFVNSLALPTALIPTDGSLSSTVSALKSALRANSKVRTKMYNNCDWDN